MSQSTEVTWEDYARAEGLLPWNLRKKLFRAVVKPNWIGGSDAFWYRVSSRTGAEFVRVDPSSATREPAFDHARLAAALSATSGNSYDGHEFPFDRIEYIDGGRCIQFDISGDRWTCDLGTCQCTRQSAPKEPVGQLLSPDGKRAAFVKDHNVWIRIVSTGSETPLTHDGVALCGYGSSPEANTFCVTNRLSGRPQPPVAVWSPDSTKLVVHRLDQRKVLPMHLLQSAVSEGSRPVVHEYRMPLVGDEFVSASDLVVLDVTTGALVTADSPPEPVSYLTAIEFGRVWWGRSSDRVYHAWSERGDKALRFYVTDANTGATRQIMEERASSYVELHHYVEGFKPNVRILGEGERFIWFSERDGWGHLYLCDGTSGEVIAQVTRGPWFVHDILYVDEAGGRICFSAGGREAGRDPCYRHVYRVGLDGADLRLLTPEDAEHEVVFSPSGKYFVDTFSRVDLAPVSVLRTSDGSLVRVLEEADIGELLSSGWTFPERFTVKARDGVTDLYGVIYRPPNLDANRKYPVLDSIYPGPQIIRTQKAFWVENAGLCEATAQLGFIVVTIDGLGTSLRSKAFHDYAYGRLENAGGLEDHIAGLRQLAARHQYMDLERVGIFGHSGGGFASTHAIFSYPDFFKVAVASAGSHDNRGYLAWWGEKYQGLLKGDNYAAQANASLARHLKGKLLLAYGDMDDNVHPAMTIQVIDALIKANKDFDLIVMPNRNHRFSLDPYFVRRRWDYFVKHLLGGEPPEGYRIADPGERAVS